MSLKKFYADPYYNIRSFALQAAIATLICIALGSIRTETFFAFEFTWWEPIIYALIGIYVGGESAVWIHNSTHKSFKNKTLNEICGYLAGLHQLWGLNGWRLIHLVHHQYSDNVEHDPHPPRGRSFWVFARDMFVQSSFTISKRYRDHWGEAPRTRMLQKMVFAAFVTAVVSTATMWYLLLGPVAFVFGYIPSLVWNHIFFAHINYYCHPADDAGQTAATNLNHNLYYKISNIFWHGIYFHGNHHKKPSYFNTRKMPERQPRSVDENKMQEVA